jgi:hypothetical protein
MTASYNGAGTATLNIGGSYTSVTLGSPAHGTVTSTGGAGVSYAPYSGFSGTDTFTFSASGPGGVSNTSTETVTVGAAAPTVGNGNLTVAYGTSGQIVAYISGVYTSVSASNGSHGSVTLSGDTATYTPNGGYSGSDSFTISATGPGGTGTGTISVTVQPQSAPPAPGAPSVGNVYLTVPYGTSGSVGLSISGTYSSISVGAASHGSVTASGATVTYTPAAAYYGADAITYSATGPGGSSGIAQISITVSPPPPPTISGGSISTPYNTSGSVNLSVGGIYTSIAYLAPTHGSVTLNGTTATYTPSPGYYGADSFQVSATGPGGTSTSATVAVQVQLPPPPTTANTTLNLAYNTGGSVTLPAAGVYTGAQIVGHPADGSVVLNGYSATYTPNAGYYGFDTFTYEIVGPGGDSTLGTTSVTVNLPPPPTAGPASISTLYQTPGSVSLPVGGVYDQIAIVQMPAHGTAVIAGATVTYTPAAGFSGSDSFTYVVGGIGGVSSVPTVSVTVGLPGAPAAQPESLSTPYQTAGSVTLQATGNWTSFALGLPPSHGSVTVTGSTATYMPAAGYYGPDAFTYTATGPGGISAQAQVTVQVGLPDPPAANPVTLTTPYGAAVSTPLSGTGVITGAALGASPSHGTAVVSSSGRTATYTPSSTYIGQDQFTYTLSGPGGTSVPATVSVTVIAPSPPTTSPATVTTPFQTAVNISLGVSGLETSLTVVGQPAHGTVVLVGSLATYTPAAGYYGADSFSFSATGPGGTSSLSLVSITVGLPGPPTVSAESASTPYQMPVAIPLQVSGSYLSLTSTSPLHGAVMLSGTTAVYTPSSGFTGVDTFTYTAVGVGGNSVPAQVQVTVGPPGVPVALSEQLTAPYQTPASVGLAAVGAATGYVVATQPSHGVVVISNGSAIYTPASGYSGADSFTYVAIGPGGTSAPATVSVTVLPIGSSAPFVEPLTTSTPYQTPIVMTMQVVGAYSSLAAVAQPAHGSVTLSGALATYTPAQGFSGPDTYTVQAEGAGGASNIQTMTVFVGYPAMAVVSPVTISTPYQTPVSSILGAAGAGTYAATTQPSHGGVSIAGNLATYTPAAGYIGTDSFSFSLTNSNGSVASATFTVTVLPPSPPTTQPQTISTPYQTSASAALKVSGVYSSITIAGQPASGTVALSNAIVTYTPANGFSGTVTFTYTATGPGGTSPVTTVTVVVGLPPAPVGAPVSTTTPYGAPVSIPLPVTGVATSVSVVTPPAHGSVTISGTTATYTPAPGFSGVDTFTYVVVGPGGKSPVVTVTITVLGPIPTAPNLSEAVKSGGTLTLQVAQGFTSAPVTAVALGTQPSEGRAALNGLVIVYSAPTEFSGVTTFTYTLTDQWGTSAPGTITLQVEPVPIPMVKQGSVLTGKTVTVDLTSGAEGGPFTSATVLAMSPASAGSAVIRSDGSGGFKLVFTPLGAVKNKVVVQYTLSNLYASAVGVVNIQVNPRPDPALDPEVTGVVNAFTQAAEQFIDGQLSNIDERLESLHNGPRRSKLGLSLLPMATVEAMGQAGTEQMQRDKDYYLKAGMAELGPTNDRTRNGKPPPGEDTTPAWSAWIGGALSLGYQYGQGETLGGFSFSTTAISAGMDTNLAKHWTGGVGLGYGQDESAIGQHDTKVVASSINAFVYETWLPTEKTFLDAVLGGGGLSFGERRYLTTDGGTVTGKTSGADAFASIKVGYEHRARRLHLSPYLAVKVSYLAISRFAEPEDPTDTWSLIYHGQDTLQATGVVGVKGDYLFRTLFGDVLPTFKLEASDDFVSGGEVPVSYEDWALSPLYPVKIQAYGAERFTAGLGFKFLTAGGVASGLMVENTFEGRSGSVMKFTANLKVAF